MKATELYQRLEKDFDLAHCRDDWSKVEFNEFISENFKKRYMGLMADNAKEINKVYTAVFPTEEVINCILAGDEKDAMLFIHHPMIWEIDGKNGVFRSIPEELLKKLRDSRIAIYNLHTPLDNFGEYSTCVSLAKALGMKIEESFYEYFGHPAGVIGKTDLSTIDELVEKVKKAVGHEVKLWHYGSGEINEQLVGVIGGGGNDVQALGELKSKRINAFVTGVTRKTDGYEPAIRAHNFANANKINIIGATHYSTEKFACIAIVDYFKNLGLEAEFIPDNPDFEDMNYGMGSKA
jgi:putative NIF3 family GTP cyclohydrolase 1 type 2